VNSYRDTHSFESDSTGGTVSETPSAEPRVRALIIEDELDICYLLKGILRYKNVDADYVTSLGEADLVLRDSAPPVVFLDNHLSDGLGVHYIARVKKKFPDTKVIMLTAHDTQADRELAMREGVDLFIGKPFTRDVIGKALDTVNL